MGGNGVMITQPASSKQSAALAGWLVQRLKGMKQVFLGYPKKRSVLVTFPLPDPRDDGTFSDTHLVLSSMAAAEVGESFQLGVFEMGMYATTADQPLQQPPDLSWLSIKPWYPLHMQSRKYPQANST